MSTAGSPDGEWNASSFVALDDEPSDPLLPKRPSSSRPSPPPPVPSYASFSSAFSARPTKRKLPNNSSAANTPRGYANQFAAAASSFSFGNEVRGTGATTFGASGTEGSFGIGRNEGASAGGEGQTSASGSVNASGSGEGGYGAFDQALLQAAAVEALGLDPHHEPSHQDDLLVNAPPPLRHKPPSKRRRRHQPSSPPPPPSSLLHTDTTSSLLLPEVMAQSHALALTKARAQVRYERQDRRADLATPEDLERRREREEKHKMQRKVWVERRSIRRPEVPGFLLVEGSEEAKEALKRARDPEFAIGLVKTLELQRERLHLAYNALNDELIKVQIEGAVIESVQSVLVEERQRLRDGERVGSG